LQQAPEELEEPEELPKLKCAAMRKLEGEELGHNLVLKEGVKKSI
jgi:hypothetical protein